MAFLNRLGRFFEGFGDVETNTGDLPEAVNHTVDDKVGNTIVSRRGFIRGVVGAGILLGLEGCDGCGDSKKPRRRPSESEVREEYSKDHERLVQKIEAAMEKLEAQLVPKIMAQVTDEGIRKKLLRPFALVKANKTNPYRKRIDHMDLVKNVDDPVAVKFLNDERLFAYDFVTSDPKEINPVQALYNRAMRIIGVNPYGNFDDVTVAAQLYHELIHLDNDDEWRALAAEGEFRDYPKFLADSATLTGQNKIILDDEVEAYVRQIQMIDIFLDGDLSRVIRENQPVDRADLARRLNTVQGEDTELEGILTLASMLFKTEMNDGKPSSEFVDFLLDVYRDKGEMYKIQEDGSLLKI